MEFTCSYFKGNPEDMVSPTGTVPLIKLTENSDFIFKIGNCISSDESSSDDFSPQTPIEWFYHNWCHAKDKVDWEKNKDKYSKQISNCDCEW